MAKTTTQSAAQTANANEIPSYDTFSCWFLHQNDDIWKVVDRSTNEEVGLIDESDLDLGATGYTEFQLFKSRPEYLVGKPIYIDANDLGAAVQNYETLLLGAQLIRAREAAPNRFDDSLIQKYSRCLEWLRKSDFYVAPASTQYHESFKGGLLIHSLKVYNAMLDLKSTVKFRSISLASAALVSLVHDWCKIGLYEPYDKNVKNESTGKWGKELAFRTNQTGVPLGHGASSMFLASRFWNLSPDEACAIRWHMGAWRVVDSEMNELQSANEKYPLVHLIQFADQLSIVSY